MIESGTLLRVNKVLKSVDRQFEVAIRWNTRGLE
jgi:hypothetical protein